jgi:hypothetical protein|tara:strand:+ start:151 stop:357 length:207 start_codon:yes stop_codon:yes gene_type:complete
MPMKKPLYKLKINGLDIEITSKSDLTIYDPMFNLDNGEAVQICRYLYREGFIDKDDTDGFAIEIISPS